MEERQTDSWSAAHDWGLLILRAALGTIFIAHGAQKLFGWFGGPGFTATLDMFGGAMGIPVPLAILAMVTEFFGGLAVLLGILTRTAGAGLAFVMLVAVLKVHAANGFFLGAAGEADGFEYNWALGAMGLCLMLTGPGRIALGGDTERWIARRLASGKRAALRNRGTA